MSNKLLEVTNLKKYFPVTGAGAFLSKNTGYVRAVDGVSFNINRGEAFGLVGESGSGKTTLGQAVLRMTSKTSGNVNFSNIDIYSLPKKDLKKLRSKAQYIFQDPYSSLNPRMEIGRAIAEPLLEHGLATKDDVIDMVKYFLSLCGLDPSYINRLPHEFSGGQRQRIVIARAMALNPEFIVADEPISALDVSIQAQIINLFSDLRNEKGLSYLFISHDLSVVEHLCDRIAIMYLGIIVELASRDELFSFPKHPYTKALLSAVPIPDPTLKRNRIILSGSIPSPTNPPYGCRFHTRCPHAQKICEEIQPMLKDVSNSHKVACHLV
ncbi:peptide/nickel transport system ATP-binding protein [Clostridium acetobutylicum]|uniref:Oligopeptide ABC transporter, ATPase component n=1 Tax=Clostridium acetobutylicum (strain ATCC 824 / DSM 792 / JCM 1419 / IAM 19013 / LMG 5710 / NBRC 13948 / NRRL B-527 / VKM B-1787 / 2291 / W) TaxID=272562 RepID=Q97ED0_CLOAB|nr:MULTISPECIES: ABC transporter ATP-binding protein [Clostridium]AAK81120.1 Oligopeptide ABC transporter, ATPase component [Clostridium acetobutylicum ATCC 824]ADZ22224.1 Oligopeptide ABC transporter, ATPase component [Clostridium acetobutylicum EA 2018]AEI34554.1 oligopeptide ABC transporter, ATPase component [Clostridium acetobutylicum DSM 1731]AWV82096.1 ABC transporter ATP-binding protein [Clostridium acetobutylicum]AWV82145.1 ABC transporter ATP-binding protein [Clostridium acetobutylicu